MTTTIVFAATSDNYLSSGGTSSYSDALSGTNLITAASGDTSMFFGQRLESGNYNIWQTFVEFPYSAAADSLPVGAYYRVTSSSATGTSVIRRMEVQTYDWGSTVDTGDWRTPGQLSLSNDNMVAHVNDIQDATVGQHMRAGLEPLTIADTSATLRYVINSSNNRQQQSPSGLEYNGLRSADYSGTVWDPVFLVAATTDHLLNRSLGAQVQLSDGTHALIRFQDVAADESTNEFVHHDGATARIIDTFSGQTEDRRGAQCYAMARDSSDNVYVINQSSTHNTLNCRVFRKQSGHNWATGDLHQARLPTYDGDINQVALTWHPQGGSRGTLVCIVGHAPVQNAGTPLSYALVDCDHLFAGHASSDPTLRDSGNAEGVLVDRTAPAGFNSYPNEASTLLDVTAASVGSDRGFLVCTNRKQTLGQRNAQSIGRYRLNSSGTGFVSTARTTDSTSGFSVKDADAKSRVLPISASQFATVNASDSDDFGVVVKHRQSSADSSDFVTLADARLDTQNLTTMPAPSTLATSSAWDAVYNPLDNRVWVYYFDTADGNRLMRTHVDLNTGESGQDEMEVNATVGATGSTNHAIRVHRHHLVGEKVLLSVANEDGGTHSLLFVTDRLNAPPDQPSLIPEPNYDADEDATFEWTFQDPNTVDAQTAFELEIDNASTGASAYRSGKVSSATESHTVTGGTLTNGNDYRWRVRAYDETDEVSPWSNYSTFTTSNSGSVTITDPSVDNDPDILTANYAIAWNVTGATQEEYRVVVVRSDTGAELVNTGWVTSTDTTYEITGMASDVEYEVQVTIRDTGVESNTATRLITPDYETPEQPVVTTSVHSTGGYILVSVENPMPQGDRPNPTANDVYRREADSGDDWVRLARIDPNSSHRDYTAASGVTYSYMARAGL